MNLQGEGTSEQQTKNGVGPGVGTVFLGVYTATTGIPSDQLRETTDKLLSILQDPYAKIVR
jgi:hypothetical protein